VHRSNLDEALSWLVPHPAFRWTAECALQVISYVEQRPPAAGRALTQALRDGKTGLSALFAHLLTGLLDHETFARAVWPAGLFARDQGLGYLAAQIADVPGQVATFPTLLAASGVRYLASGVNPERAAPLLSPTAAARAQLTGDWTTYPQLYWWQGPDGSRVLHWRFDGYADGPRFGFDVGADEMARRLSDWLLTHPVFASPAYPYDVALLVGAAGDNGPADGAMVANVEEFNRRYAFPRLMAARPEEFFRDVEQRWGTKVPVRRGDTGCYREDGAAAAAAELAQFRETQLAARAAELLALWDEKTEPRNGAAARIERRAADRRRMWRQLLLFGEHTWGSSASLSDPDGAPVSTVMDESYKVAITRLGDRIRVGGTAEISGYSDRLDAARRATLDHSLTDMFPRGGDLGKATFWCGLRPMTPDGPPVIGATRYSNLHLNTGHGTLGWTMACGSGRVLADLMSGRKPDIDVSELNVSRYDHRFG